MTQFNNDDARKHLAYNAAIRHAAERAYRNPGDCFSVWFDGQAVYVRAFEAARPNSEARLICVAQQLNGNEIELRFTGGHSEHVYV